MINYFKSHYKIGIIGISILFLIATNLYTYLAYLNTPPAHTYTGANLFAGADKLIYLSMIEQGKTGDLMMLNLHTSEPQKGLFFSPHWWIIGRTAEVFNHSSLVAYQIWRIILTVSFLTLLFYFLKKLFRNPVDRLLASMVTLFSLGVGWYAILIKPSYLAVQEGAYQRLAIDIYLAETFPFIAFGQSPLFMLSYILILLVFYLFIKWRNAFVWRQEVLVGCLAFILILIHPYDIWIIAPLLGLLTLVKFKRSKNVVLLSKFGLFAFFVLLAAVYLLLTLQLEPAMSGWLKQNLVYSPPLANYLIGLGFITPLWLYGSFIVYKRYRQNVWWLLLLLWSWYIWLIIYLPVQYNRRFTAAWLLPLGIIAYLGAKELVLRYKNIGYRVTATFVLFFLLFGGTFLSLATQTLALNYQQDKKILYVPNVWMEALEVLKEDSTEEDIVLASTGFGNSMVASYVVPAFSGRRVYLGSKHQTVDYLLKQQQIDEFFNLDNGLNKENFLKEKSIDYIFVDLEDADQGSYSWLLEANYLEPIYINEKVLLLKVL